MANDNQGPLLTGVLLAGGGYAGYLAGRRLIDRWLSKHDVAGAVHRPFSITALQTNARSAGIVKAMLPSPTAKSTAHSVGAPAVRLPPVAHVGAPPRHAPRRPIVETLSTRFDPIFEQYRGAIPIEYMRALAMRESSMHAGERSGPAWGLMQIIEVVRLDYNRAHGTRYARKDLLDPAVNVAMATWLLRLIMRSYQRNHPNVPNLQPDWSNPRFVELLTFGWNAGFSEAGGVGRVARYLEAGGTIDITIDLVHLNARAAGASRHLSRADKVRWCKGVVALYRRELERCPPRPDSTPLA